MHLFSLRIYTRRDLLSTSPTLHKAIFKQSWTIAFVMSVMALFITSFDVQAKIAQTKFIITPQGSSMVTVAPDVMEIIEYTVTNKLPTQERLVMSHVQGVTQVTSGGGDVCQNPMVLGSGRACTLVLSVDGSRFPLGQTTTLANTPQICIASNQLSCSQPNPADWLKISVEKSYRISGTISGLVQPVGPFTLTNNGGDAIHPTANGTFSFPAKVSYGANYNVVVSLQATGQTCKVSYGSGVVKGPVTNVSITCGATSYKIGGTISGLTANGLILQNNLADNTSLRNNARSYDFPTQLPSGAHYSVTVFSQPTGQTCTVSNASDTVTGDVTNADVFCQDYPPVPPTGLTGVVTGLPAVAIAGTAYPVTFTFTNNNLPPLYPQMIISTNTPQPAEAYFTNPQDNCPPAPTPPPPPITPGGALVGGTSCPMTGTFSTQTPGTYTLTATLATSTAGPGPTTVTLTAQTTVVPAGGARTINFVNNCPFKVWFSMAGGAITSSPNCAPSAAPRADCPTGTSCDPLANKGLGICFWNNPIPSNGNYELLANGGNNTVTVPAPPDNTLAPNTQWSGIISASTLCDGTKSCGQADCGNKGGSSACAVGYGFSQPATQAEFTMIKNAADYFDVEVINGFHLPIKVTANNPSSVSGYYCGSPGTPTAENHFGACNWDNASGNLPAPTSSYYWVTHSTACNNDGSCPTSGQLCGLDSNVDQVCGDFLGFWTADNACGVAKAKANPYFGCTYDLGGGVPPPPPATWPGPWPPNPASPFSQGAGLNMYSLYACVTPDASQPLLNSCYRTDAVSNCCGCANWQDLGITLPSDTQLCTTTSDTMWSTYVQPTIKWMKTTCPSYYTYPFDDKSSSFRCSDAPGGVGSNSVGYTFTFCPLGPSGSPTTGLPSGITDGRV